MKIEAWKIVAAVVLGAALWFVASIHVVPLCARPKSSVAATQAATWSHAVVQFLTDHRRLPRDLHELTQPDPQLGDQRYVDREPIDPWENDFVFATAEGGGFMVVSFGSDGNPGGVDDAADIVDAHLPSRR